MTKPKAYLVGNALVDMVQTIDDEGLIELNIQKGVMQLVEQERSQALYAGMSSPIRSAGGSAANTAAVIAALGGDVEYVSKVGNDETGQFFADDMKRMGVHYQTEFDASQDTGKCMIFVTEDGERSMNTFLGASEHLSANDLADERLKSVQYLYLEGYRYDGEDSQEAFIHAAKTVHKHDGVVAVTLSDPFCVERHRAKFKDLISYCDLVFCNEHELQSLTEEASLETACQAVLDSQTDYIVTAGARGAFIVSKGEIHHFPTKPVDMIDATGAGDYFAGGFLSALMEGLPYEKAVHYGNICAGEVIQVMGTRVQSDLRAIIDRA